MTPPFRVAIIGRTGHGDYGHGLDTAWLRIPEAHIVGVSDDDPRGLAQAGERLKQTSLFADYRQMLDATKPHIVSIGPRWIDQHHAMLKACVERGIHVFVEKPFCRTLEEADEIIRLSEMTHAQIAVAHTTRFSPHWAIVVDLLRQGIIGDILEIRGRGKEDTRGGGEDLWVLGSHIMDMLRGLAGDPQWCVARVTTQGQPFQMSHVIAGNEGLGSIAGDRIEAQFGFAHDVVAYFSSRRGAAGERSRFGVQIFGTRGVLETGTGYLPPTFVLEESSWSSARSDKKWTPISSAGLGQAEPLDARDTLQGHVLAARDLLRAVSAHTAPVVDGPAGRAAVEMILACFASARHAASVSLPLASRSHPLA